jgi:hypothetical protein
MRIMHVSPKFAWQTATATDDFYNDGFTPRKAFIEEISNWYD